MTETEFTKGVDKFAIFAYNYPHNFIEKVWQDNESLRDHLRAKFNGYYKTHGSTAVMIVFYLGLSQDHRTRLANYIKTVKL